MGKAEHGHVVLEIEALFTVLRPLDTGHDGCPAPGCGNVAELTGSWDLDHYPWTFVAVSTNAAPKPEAWGSAFPSDPNVWEAAIQSFSARPMGLLAAEIQESRLTNIWPNLTVQQWRAAMNALSWMWNSAFFRKEQQTRRKGNTKNGAVIMTR